MGIPAKRVKEILSNALERLEGFDDEAEIQLFSNTYFLGDCHYFLGVSGYYGGYVNLDNPQETEGD